jgi:hypothetical protein
MVSGEIYSISLRILHGNTNKDLRVTGSWEVEGFYYSVPRSLVKQKLDIRYTKNTVECFYSNKRVANHLRNIPHGRHVTIKGEEHAASPNT